MTRDIIDILDERGFIDQATNLEELRELIEVDPYYTHSYGKFVPEIIQIDKQLREIMDFGGDK